MELGIGLGLGLDGHPLAERDQDDAEGEDQHEPHEEDLHQ